MDQKLIVTLTETEKRTALIGHGSAVFSFPAWILQGRFFVRRTLKAQDLC